MDKQGKHTPLPWRAGDGNLCQIWGVDNSRPSFHRTICRLGSEPRAHWSENYRAEVEANAELIVTAVNERSSLLSEIARLREALGDCRCPRPMNSDPDDLTIKSCTEIGHCGCALGAALTSTGDDR